MYTDRQAKPACHMSEFVMLTLLLTVGRSRNKYKTPSVKTRMLKLNHSNDPFFEIFIHFLRVVIVLQRQRQSWRFKKAVGAELKLIPWVMFITTLHEIVDIFLFLFSRFLQCVFCTVILFPIGDNLKIGRVALRNTHLSPPDKHNSTLVYV